MDRLWFWRGALMSAIACTACAAEEVDFDADLGDAGSATVLSDATTASTDARATPGDAISFLGPPDGFSFLFDARAPPFPRRDAALTCCMADGNSCESASDCCSGHCDQGSCIPFLACGEPGTVCNSHNDCCSGRCESTPGTSAFTCMPYCATRDAACTRASDCCSLGCNHGKCGGPICNTVGTACVASSDCCSGQCTEGRCETVSGSCLPTGEACADDAGDFCCSGVCNQVTGRCDQGNSGMCRAAWSPCILPVIPFQAGSNCQCCTGNCVNNSEETVAVCVPDGTTDF